MFVCVEPHAAMPPTFAVGVKPPWNQPQVTCLALSSSPMFVPLMAMVEPDEHWSWAGSASPYTVPLLVTPDSTAGVTPWVCPETRLSTPGVDGPKPVLNELSLIANRCA